MTCECTNARCSSHMHRSLCEGEATKCIVPNYNPGAGHTEICELCFEYAMASGLVTDVTTEPEA